MMRLLPWRGWEFAALLLGCAGWAGAHPLPAGQGTLNLVGQRVFLVVSLAKADFVDSSSTPIAAADQAADWAAKLQQAVDLRDGQDVAQWKEALVMASAPDDLDHVLAMAVAEFAQPPQTLALHMKLLGQKEVITLRATRTLEGQPGPQELGILSSAKPQFVFFAPWWQRLAEFAQVGFAHIMEGWDHLLFLVALLATAMTVRRWAVLLTGFTLAHGLTFGLASLGWVSAPAALVEPAIAASIALVAGLHLWGVRLRLRWELALVVALGLVHGLGFASAMQESGQALATQPGAYPVLGIVGFNLGVEGGQGAVALALYLIVQGLQRLAPQAHAMHWQRGLSATAATVACYWLVQRIS